MTSLMGIAVGLIRHDVKKPIMQLLTFQSSFREILSVLQDIFVAYESNRALCYRERFLVIEARC